MMHWNVGWASVTGSSHTKAGKHCQDYSVVISDSIGSWNALVACDGAGSAAKAQEGAEFVATQFSRLLLN